MTRSNTATSVLFASMLAAVLTVTSALDASAAHGGAGGSMRGTNGHAGGNSASHISAQGLAHTNGPNAPDRDFGRDRAEDVRSSHAFAHSRSSLNRARTTAHRNAQHMTINKWDTLTSL